MSKFHINKNGVPAPCKAKEGNCPLGGSDTHFKSQEEAQAYSDNLSQTKHGLLPSVNSKTKGYVKKEKNLRQKLQIEMNEYKGKKVKIEYDGKTEEGKVREIHFGTSPGFIIEGEDGFKHIKLARIQSLQNSAKKQQVMGGILSKAISKEPFYKVRYNEDGVAVAKEFTPENYNALNDWDNVYETEDLANVAAEQVRLVDLEKDEMKNSVKTFVEDNFRLKPQVPDNVLMGVKEDLADIENKINKDLKDNPNFKAIQFDTLGTRGIRVKGFNTEVEGYSYGYEQLLKMDLSNKDEVVSNFVKKWKENDNQESLDSFKRFIESGEKDGWD